MPRQETETLHISGRLGSDLITNSFFIFSFPPGSLERIRTGCFRDPCILRVYPGRRRCNGRRCNWRNAYSYVSSQSHQRTDLIRVFASSFASLQQAFIDQDLLNGDVRDPGIQGDLIVSKAPVKPLDNTVHELLAGSEFTCRKWAARFTGFVNGAFINQPPPLESSRAKCRRAHHRKREHPSR